MRKRKCREKPGQRMFDEKARKKKDEPAGVTFALKGITAEYAAKCAVEGMFARKTLIIPTLKMKIADYGAGFLPPMLLAKIAGFMQKKKGDV